MKSSLNQFFFSVCQIYTEQSDRDREQDRDGIYLNLYKNYVHLDVCIRLATASIRIVRLSAFLFLSSFLWILLFFAHGFSTCDIAKARSVTVR